LVCTSAVELQGHPTGLWIEELACPYYLFKEKGYEIVIASPAGGPVPIDAASLGEGFFTDEAKKFMHDGEAVGKLSHSVKVETIDFSAGDIDAIVTAGGHGTVVDFNGNPALKSALETMYNNDKIVASICHGPNCLVDCMQADGKTPLVQGKTVTGFADSEEAAVQLDSKVPFLLESKLKELGANYVKADDWNSKCCVDGKLITGQNPQSSGAVAQAVIEVLSA